ncbi:sigma-70 family RNA polymerase sigma factor [Catenovulum sp. 2E275]|uniref:RNA polymerase sigma factor n=1 Tax=Catenovulum sp. 2E275 TaxID=2980497 RepID=UPI0021D192ED|nr:sigma-70 family RNA polymerase sigma factor [Catenovulum sp. 2E275]MCU4676676.1 sigma-70 family RNA polymerase sigma factor [Catenovulum sp. 2E275]
MNKSEFSITSALLKEEPKLKAMIRRWVKTHDDQADVYQETLTTVIERNQSEPIQNPLAYAVTVARHFAWKLSGNNNANNHDSYDETLDPRQTQSAEVNYLQQEKIKTIQAVLNNMPPMRQQVFIRRRLQNQSREQIAKELELSEEAVKKHINRALAQIAMHLGE